LIGLLAIICWNCESAKNIQKIVKREEGRKYEFTFGTMPRMQLTDWEFGEFIVFEKDKNKDIYHNLTQTVNHSIHKWTFFWINENTPVQCSIYLVKIFSWIIPRGQKSDQPPPPIFDALYWHIF
jgi:hypothetical protein